MAKYGESIFTDQDDLVERAVAWLCEASEDAGESVGEWAETLGMVGDRLAGLHCAAMAEVDCPDPDDGSGTVADWQDGRVGK